MNPVKMAVEVLKQDPDTIFEGIGDISSRDVVTAMAKFILIMAEIDKED